MARPKARRLKVFQAQIGFYDTVVAAPSRAAALRAWGTRQDLFASGEAREVTDEAAVAAALERPETPLRRAVGSNAPFELEPKSVPRIPDTPRPRKRPSRKPAPAPSPPSPPDRSRLDAAEAALRTLDAARKREEAGFRREAEALEARRNAAQSAYAEARRAATAVVVQARQAYREAGGRD